MAEKSEKKKDEMRAQRLKAALKANMAKRKAQARGRAVQKDAKEAEQETPDG